MKFKKLALFFCETVIVCGATGCSAPSGVGPQNTKVGAVVSRPDNRTPVTNDEVVYQQEEIKKILQIEAERKQRELHDLQRQDYQNNRLREYEHGH